VVSLLLRCNVDQMRNKMTRSTTVLLAVILLCATVVPQYRGARPVSKKWGTGFRTISAADAKEILEVLAGPDFRGRSPRNADYAAAAGYTTSLLRSWGLKPAGDNGSYFQRFVTESVSVVPEATTLQSADGSVRLEFRKDFVLRAQEDFESTEKIAFLRVPTGADISALDLTEFFGRMVILRPGTATDNREAYRKLIDNWGAPGRARIITPATRPEALRSTPVSRVKGIPTASTDRFSAFTITNDAAKRLAEYCGAKGYLAETSDAVTVESCASELVLRSKVSVKDDISSFNVVATIEGSDPVLRNEYVAIGAHLDHFGQTERGVRWGADDNASGVTSALLIARAITRNPVKPKRSILIGLWAMEESGLLGSWNYVNRPSVPIEKTIAYLNMDQVGRDEEDPRYNEKAEANTTSVYLGSVKFNSEDLYQLLRGTNEYIRLMLKPDREDRTLRSDTASFFRKGVPTLKAFTGEHPDYHQETDTPNKINYIKLTNIAKWLYISTMELATRPERPRFHRTPFEPGTVSDATGVKAAKLVGK
jgi:hypothetical protein